MGPAPGLDTCFGCPDFVWEQTIFLAQLWLPWEVNPGMQVGRVLWLWPGIQLRKFREFRTAGYDKEGFVPQQD